MKKQLFLYALAIGLAAFALQWLEYHYVIRTMPGEIYIVLIAASFTALGLWGGYRLTQKTSSPSFTKNTRALSALGVTRREYEVLELLAKGHANKDIARRLGVSPNTIKTHLNRLYEKLSVQRRTQAIHKAKTLALIP